MLNNDVVLLACYLWLDELGLALVVTLNVYIDNVLVCALGPELSYTNHTLLLCR